MSFFTSTTEETRRFPRPRSPGAGIVFGGLMAALLLAACGSAYRDHKVATTQAAMEACIHEATNDCANANIDFDIAVLQANTPDRIWLFTELRTPEDMKREFGESGYRMFEESVAEIRDKAVAALESHRPGWFASTFLGSRPPANGDMPPAMQGPEDFEPFKQAMLTVFVRKLKAAGWTPTDEQRARFGADAFTPGAKTATASTPTPSTTGVTSADSGPPLAAAPAVVATPPTQAPIVADASPVDQPTPAAPPPDLSPILDPPPGSDPFTPEWKKVRQQIKDGPEVFLSNCVAMYLKSQQQLGGVDPATNTGVPELCRGLLTDYTACMKQEASRSQKCFDDRNQDLE